MYGVVVNDKNKNFSVPRFISVPVNRVGARDGGVLFLVRKNLAFKVLGDLKCPDNGAEIGGIKITNVNLPFNLICVYRPPGRVFTQFQWDGILSNVNMESHTLFVGILMLTIPVGIVLTLTLTAKACCRLSWPRVYFYTILTR